MASKEETLARIRSAIGTGTRRASRVPASEPRRPSQQSAVGDLVTRFCGELERVGGRTSRVSSQAQLDSALLGLLPDGAAIVVALSDGAVVRQRSLRELFKSREVEIVPTLTEFAAEAGAGDQSLLLERYKSRLLKAEIGITSADYAIADTGTLVLVARDEHHRLISLVPPVHVCLLDATRIVANLSELLSRVRREHYSGGGRAPHVMTLVTGTSKTADIEQTLVKGVHGPRELHVVVYS